MTDELPDELTFEQVHGTPLPKASAAPADAPDELTFEQVHGTPDAETEAPSKENQTWGEWLADSYVAGARGMRDTLPFAKDISAASRAVLGNPLTLEKPSYEFTKEKRAVERQQEEAATESPVAYKAGMGAGILASLPAYELAAPAEAATTAALAPTVGQTAAKAVGAGLTGAGIGAVQGLGEGETLEDRLRSAGSGALLGGGAGAVMPVVAKGASKVLGLKATPSEEAAARLGKSVPAAVASENLLTRGLTTAVEGVPGAKDFLKTGVKKSIEELGETLKQAPTKIGATPGVNARDAGTAAGQSLRDWITSDSKAGVDALYNTVKAHVDPTITTPLTNTLAAVQSIDTERLAAKLGDSDAAKLVLDAATDPNGLTYAGAQRLKREIGRRLNGVITESNLDDAELKRLYEGLRQDVRASAQNAGGKAGLKAFDEANAHAQEVILQRKALGKIVGAKGDAPDEKVYGALVRIAKEGPSGDLELLRKARASMKPAAWNDVTSSMINQMGRDVEGAFSPDRFVTEYGKLPAASRDVLFGPAGNPLRQALDDVYTVAQRYKEVGKGRNHSNTAAAAIGGLGLLDVALEGPFAGLEHDAAIGAGAIPLAFILSKPRAARAIANLLKNPGPGAERALRNAVADAMGETGAKNASEVYRQISDMRNPNNREERADGGKIDKRDYPAKRLTRIERAAKRAREALALESKPLMNMPDEQVADALRIAEKK